MPNNFIEYGIARYKFYYGMRTLATNPTVIVNVMLVMKCPVSILTYQKQIKNRLKHLIWIIAQNNVQREEMINNTFHFKSSKNAIVTIVCEQQMCRSCIDSIALYIKLIILDLLKG